MASGNTNNDGFGSKRDSESSSAREPYETAKDHNGVPRCQSPIRHPTKIKDPDNLVGQLFPSTSTTLEPESLRQSSETVHQKCNEKLLGTFKGLTEEKLVKTNSTEIPITIYTPVDVNKDKLVIFFHGGGWVVCSRKTHQTIVNTLADATKTTWISVEYRLGPEHKYPIWLDDASDVTQHIIENKVTYGVNPTAKVGVSGDSAGGMISASLARTLKNIDFQILIYAALDLIRETPSYQEFVHPMYCLPSKMLDWTLLNGYRSNDDLKDPRVSALLNKSLEGVAPCLFVVADLDPLRDGSIEYQKLLEQAGVKTKLVVIKGVIHGFMSSPGIFPNACAEGVDAVRQFMASI